MRFPKTDDRRDTGLSAKYDQDNRDNRDGNERPQNTLASEVSPKYEDLGCAPHFFRLAMKW